MGWFRLSVLSVERIAIVRNVITETGITMGRGRGAVKEEGEGVLPVPQLLKLKEAIFK